MSLRNLIGALRWIRFRLEHPGEKTGLFFVDRRATIFIAPPGSLSVGRGVIILHDFTARIEGPVELGNRVFFNRGCHLVVKSALRIGDDCLFGEYVAIHDEAHIIENGEVKDRNAFTSDPITIGRKVWVGAKATILRGVSLGDRCVIGANAVVTKDVPPGAIAVGVPARVVGYIDDTDPPPSDAPTRSKDRVVAGDELSSS